MIEFISKNIEYDFIPPLKGSCNPNYSHARLRKKKSGRIW